MCVCVCVCVCVCERERECLYIIFEYAKKHMCVETSTLNTMCLGEGLARLSNAHHPMHILNNPNFYNQTDHRLSLSMCAYILYLNV